jgi:hypothetical protein
MIGLLLAILPAGSVALELLGHSYDRLSILLCVGRWWTFWAVGIPLFLPEPGRSFSRDLFTAVEIFGSHETASLPIVREAGFANLAVGTLGILSIFRPDWVVSAAMVGGLYYGHAGVGHIRQKNKNPREWTAMISDLGVCFILAEFVFSALF